MALSLTFSPKARLKPLLNDLDEYPKISKQAKSNQLLMRKNLHLKHRQIMCEIKTLVYCDLEATGLKNSGRPRFSNCGSEQELLKNFNENTNLYKIYFIVKSSQNLQNS